jgi:ribosome-associated protein
MLVVAPHIRIPLDEFEFSYVRSSGPGGQNVNKVNSKAVLRWNLAGSPSLPEDVRRRFAESFASRLTGDGELVLTSDRFRDQKKNVDDCLEKVRGLLAAVARPPKKRKKSKPTRASKERRLEGKRREGAKKQNRRRPEF